MIGNLRAGGEPNALMCLEMRKRAFQRQRTGRAPCKAAMQTDRHHLGRACRPFGVKLIKGVDQAALELRAFGETCLDCKAHIVAIHRIGHDQLILAARLDPIGQVIGIAVCDIGQIPLLRGKIHSVHGAAPRIPPARRGSCDLSMQAEGLADLRPLLLGGHIFVFHPFQAMAGNFPTRLFHRRHLFGAAGKGRGHTINCHGQVGHHGIKPPKPCTRTIFVDRLHIPMAHPNPWLRACDLG